MKKEIEELPFLGGNFFKYDVDGNLIKEWGTI
jgi:hypothetical protein